MNFKGFQLHIRNIGDQFDFDLKFRRCICTFFLLAFMQILHMQFNIKDTNLEILIRN